MKATGIVRKIDDLGRIVIPKEIRKTLRIREGDPLEIYVDKNGEIILKKYAPFGDMLELAEQYAATLTKTTGFSTCITDTEMIIAVSGASKREYLDKEISDHIVEIMDDRAIWASKDDNTMPIIKGEPKNKYNSQIISPIISDGDAIGSVILFTTDTQKKVGEIESKLVQSAATFLGKQMS